MQHNFIALMVIAWGTWLEAIRNRILHISSLFVLLLVGLSVVAATVVPLEHARLIIDVGLAAASGFGSIIAVVVTIVSFAGELSNRTAYPTLARPIGRWAFVLGKYIGLIKAFSITTMLMLLGTVGILKLYGDAIPQAVWWSIVLSWVEMSVVTAIALFFASMAVPLLAACYALGVIMAGNLSGEMLDLATTKAADNVWLSRFLQLCYAILPDLQDLSVRSQAANDLDVPISYIVHAVAYGACYSFSLVMLTVITFSRRKVV